MSEQYDFSSNLALSRVGSNNRWQQLKEQINWNVLDKLLRETDCTGEFGGRPPYDPAKMFRVILLGQWHDLSDEDLEYSLKVRLDFLLFCGFSMSDKVPDRTTINLFRNKLVSLNLLDKCLKALNQELERVGIKIKTGKLVLDSTVIESAARPRNTIEPSDDDNPPKKTTSKDPDSSWTKKGKNFHYGYKEHALVEVEQGFVEKLEVTPANVHDGTKVKSLLENQDATEFLADKAYDSKDNREFLKSRNIADLILRKGVRNKPLTPEDIKHNKIISTRRFIVEQYFGTKKRKFNFHQTRYFTTKRVHGQAVLKAICFNLLKARNMLAPPINNYA